MQDPCGDANMFAGTTLSSENRIRSQTQLRSTQATGENIRDAGDGPMSNVLDVQKVLRSEQEKRLSFQQRRKDISV